MKVEFCRPNEFQKSACFFRLKILFQNISNDFQLTRSVLRFQRVWTKYFVDSDLIAMMSMLYDSVQELAIYAICFNKYKQFSLHSGKEHNIGLVLMTVCRSSYRCVHAELAGE